MSNEYNTSLVEQFTSQAAADLASITRLLDDDRYDVGYKRDQAGEKVPAALEALTQRLNDQVGDLTAKADALEAAADPDRTPTPEEAGQLLYLRDALQARWATMTAQQFQEAWKAAIAAGDAIALRVWADFGPAAAAAKSPDKRVPLWVSPLVDQTRAARMTPAQLKKLDTAAWHRETIKELRRANVQARAGLLGVRIGGVPVVDNERLVRL